LAYWWGDFLFRMGLDTLSAHGILKSPSYGDFFKVIRWTDSDTAVFWAFSSDTSIGALFEMKVDARGNWKLATAKVLSGKVAEKQQDSN